MHFIWSFLYAVNIYYFRYWWWFFFIFAALFLHEISWNFIFIWCRFRWYFLSQLMYRCASFIFLSFLLIFSFDIISWGWVISVVMITFEFSASHFDIFFLFFLMYDFFIILHFIFWLSFSFYVFFSFDYSFLMWGHFWFLLHFFAFSFRVKYFLQEGFSFSLFLSFLLIDFASRYRIFFQLSFIVYFIIST